jgi:hypothetical protein
MLVGTGAVGARQLELAVGLGALGTRELGTGNLGTKTMGAGARGAGAMGTCQVGTGAVETRPVELRRLEQELWGPVQLEQALAEGRTGTWLGHFIGLAVTIEGWCSWNRQLEQRPWEPEWWKWAVGTGAVWRVQWQGQGSASTVGAHCWVSGEHCRCIGSNQPVHQWGTKMERTDVGEERTKPRQSQLGGSTAEVG